MFTLNLRELRGSVGTVADNFMNARARDKGITEGFRNKTTFGSFCVAVDDPCDGIKGS